MERWNSCLAILLAAGLFASCASYNRNDTAYVEKGGDMLSVLLHHASLAGSTHNSQPWKVEVYKNDSILVFADMSRKLAVIDPECRELYISLGAFVENLCLAAGTYGYEAAVKTNNVADTINLPAIVVKLRPGLKTLFQMNNLLSRRTLRSAFDTVHIKENDLAFLIGEDDGNVHYIPMASGNGKIVQRRTIEASAQQANRRAAQEELARWIRFSNDSVKEKRDGLTTAGMEIEGISGFIVRNFYKPADSQKQSFIQKGREKTKMQAENCAGWIILTQPMNDKEAWINTGRLYQKINIKCCSLKIGFQPMNQAIEEKDIEKELSAALGYQGNIQLIARIGYVADYPAPVSVRRPVESFATFK